MQSRKVCFELSYLHSRVRGVGWWWAPLWVLSLRQPKAEPRTNHHTRHSEERGSRTRLLERKRKESSNGEPPGAGLHSIYARIHVGCARLSVGLCTVRDIIVELKG